MANVLGKGLSALIKNNNLEDNSSSQRISINHIIPNKHQPRKNFHDDEMSCLINSIKKNGIIQPLTLRKLKNDSYELIAGERRLRAATFLKFKKVPAYIVQITKDSEMMELALIENIQRVDLNPIEEAEGYLILKEKYNYSQKKIAENVGKSRSEITNKMRLLSLPNEVIDGLRNKKIFYAHARALIPISKTAIIVKTYIKIIKNKLSVRQTEQLVNKILNKPNNNKLKKETITLFKYEEQLKQKLKAPITIKASNDNFQGNISIKFFSKKELLKLINLIIEE